MILLWHEINIRWVPEHVAIIIIELKFYSVDLYTLRYYEKKPQLNESAKTGKPNKRFNWRREA